MGNSRSRLGFVMQGGYNWLGGVNYTRNLIYALRSLPDEIQREFELVLITDDILPTTVSEELNTKVDTLLQVKEQLPTKTFFNRLQWSYLKRAKKIKNPRYCHLLAEQKMDFIYPFFSEDSSKLPCRSAAWIPDFQHKHLPEFFNEKEKSSRDQYYAAIADCAPAIVLSSQTAKNDLKHFYKANTSKIYTLPFVTVPSEEWYLPEPVTVQKKYQLPDRFFLVSNQFWAHKNHKILFEALHILQQKKLFPVLVCTGNLYDYRNPSYTDEILQTLATLGITNQVILLGALSRLEQLQLMRRCLAVIQPSLFEGWSTVVEDAKTLGKPILLSDLLVHHEQITELNCFFDPYSPDALASLLEKSWVSLAPGPDLASEEHAKKLAEQRTQTFGHQILQIAGVSV